MSDDTRPRPIQYLQRNLRSDPDEAEPSVSIEQESFVQTREEDEEEEFHRRLMHRRESSSGGGNGGMSFWRSSSSSDASTTPFGNSIASMVPSPPLRDKRKQSSGLLGPTLEPEKDKAKDAPEEPITRANTVNFFNAKSARENSKKGNKEATRQRAAARRIKLETQSSDIDPGHIVDVDVEKQLIEEKDEAAGVEKNSDVSTSSIDSTSDQSSGSMFYGKTANSGTMLGKSSSLIFPTGVENAEIARECDESKRRRINLLLDQCETIRFPFKKKLLLTNLCLTAMDLPLTDLCGTSLGNSLYTLSISGNRLGTVPALMVQSLPSVRHLDLSQCELHQLPDQWDLPKLTKLNLSHNRLTDFPEEVSNQKKTARPPKGMYKSLTILVFLLFSRSCWEEFPSCKSSTCTAIKFRA
jgi:hypothetical protein